MMTARKKAPSWLLQQLEMLISRYSPYPSAPSAPSLTLIWLTKWIIREKVYLKVFFNIAGNGVLKAADLYYSLQTLPFRQEFPGYALTAGGGI